MDVQCIGSSTHVSTYVVASVNALLSYTFSTVGVCITTMHVRMCVRVGVHVHPNVFGCGYGCGCVCVVGHTYICIKFG